MNVSETTLEEKIIIFIDVHHFSFALEEAAEIYAFLQAMYETLGDLISGFGGEIIKYLGDSILSVFPAGCEEIAVQCGLEMRSAFARLAAQNGLPAETELEVGIAAGKVAVGMCGHRTQRLKDVFGEEVTQAAVIGHYQGVAVTENVYEKIRGRFKTHRLPDVETKRPDKPIKAWAVQEKPVSSSKN